jgi:hypothetical protein
VDNRPDQDLTRLTSDLTRKSDDSQQSSTHSHRYMVKGSGLSCWAECSEPGCDEKFGNGSGVIVGSKGKIMEAIK